MPLASVFYRGYWKLSTTSDSFSNLGQIRSAVKEMFKKLVDRIQADRYKPYFHAEEIDNLFKTLLKSYAKGRYNTFGDLDSIDKWHDILPNIATPLVGSREQLIKHHRNRVSNEADALINKFAMGLIKFRIIEDYIYYHKAFCLPLIARNVARARTITDPRVIIPPFFTESGS